MVAAPRGRHCATRNAHADRAWAWGGTDEPVNSASRGRYSYIVADAPLAVQSSWAVLGHVCARTVLYTHVMPYSLQSETHFTISMRTRASLILDAHIWLTVTGGLSLSMSLSFPQPCEHGDTCLNPNALFQAVAIWYQAIWTNFQDLTERMDGRRLSYWRLGVETGICYSYGLAALVPVGHPGTSRSGGRAVWIQP